MAGGREGGRVEGSDRRKEERDQVGSVGYTKERVEGVEDEGREVWRGVVDGDRALCSEVKKARRAGNQGE